MQYKLNTKIIIDKRKLDVLFRLGCPDEVIMQLIKTGSFDKTGDSLIDETLECLMDVKEFDNWGGHRENAGRKPSKTAVRNQDENQLDNQDENQDANHLGNQDTNQVVDKDIDIDKDIDKDNKYRFNEFWDKYPKQRAGSKQQALSAYTKAIEEKRTTEEDLLKAVALYADSDEVKRGFAKGCAAWLNDDRFLSEYKTTEKAEDFNDFLRKMKEEYDETV